VAFAGIGIAFKRDVVLRIRNPGLEPGGDAAVMFTGLTLTFLKEYAYGLSIAYPLLLCVAAGIILLGQWVGRLEGWSHFDSFYWSFITATTVGYGDIRPVKRGSKLIAILIALLGLLLTGFLIALAVRAATVALQTRVAGS
jgi:voltage-gated potassium channel